MVARPLASLIAAAMTLTACYSPGANVPAPVQQSVIAATELRTANTSDLYDAIARLRPLFMTSRGTTSLLNEPPNAILVIVDGNVRGGLSELRNIDARLVRWVRRLSAADVYRAVGRSAPSGGIEVQLGP